MTAEYETFHTISGDTERVLTGVRGPAVYAPDLRPKSAEHAAAPMETGSGHQLEHQIRGTMTIGGQSYTATMQLRRAELEPEQSSGIGDIHCTIPAGEPLIKVLHAGGPLLPSNKFPVWDCGRCGVRSTEPTRSSCMQGHATDCPMVPL